MKEIKKKKDEIKILKLFCFFKGTHTKSQILWWELISRLFFKNAYYLQTAPQDVMFLEDSTAVLQCLDWHSLPLAAFVKTKIRTTEMYSL